jgi:excisionase family DNA binding protein
VTSGVTVGRATRPERSTAYNPLTSLQSRGPEGVRNLRPLTPFTEAFGPTLVQGASRGCFKAVKAYPAPLLTVREAAVRIRVSPVTVYRLCAEGKLRHVRVSNALRIAEEDLEGYLRTSTREKA